MEEYRIMLDNVDDKKIVSVQRRTGLLSYPEYIQRLIITTRHFPEPSKESRQILYFYLNKALSSRTSKQVEKNEMTEKLLKQGQLKKTKDGRIYLSDEGVLVAKGILKTFPELDSESKH
jgi:hypothetical protein